MNKQKLKQAALSTLAAVLVPLTPFLVRTYQDYDLNKEPVRTELERTVIRNPGQDPKKIFKKDLVRMLNEDGIPRSLVQGDTFYFGLRSNNDSPHDPVQDHTSFVYFTRAGYLVEEQEIGYKAFQKLTPVQKEEFLRITNEQFVPYYNRCVEYDNRLSIDDYETTDGITPSPLMLLNYVPASLNGLTIDDDQLPAVFAQVFARYYQWGRYHPNIRKRVELKMQPFKKMYEPFFRGMDWDDTEPITLEDITLVMPGYSVKEVPLLVWTNMRYFCEYVQTRFLRTVRG